MKRIGLGLGLAVLATVVWWRMPRTSGPRVFVVTPERSEDLRFLDASQYGIAYYAATVKLGSTGAVEVEPRWSPQMLPFRGRPYLMAVVQFATEGAPYGEQQRAGAVAAIRKLIEPEYIRGVQLVFPPGGDDDFFRSVAQGVRGAGKRVSVIVDGPCVSGDGWADEVVPRADGDVEACGGGRVYLRSAKAWTAERLQR
ncbi:MAG: hypothetical protein R2762_17750 [Bryobacteraceae bacterium]